MPVVKTKPWILFVLCVVILFGIFARFYKITEPNFVYYDEGLYLTHNISFLYYMDHHPAKNFLQTLKYLNVCWHAALADTKTIWFFLANMRTFTVGTDAFYFTRLLSAILGCLTLGLVYLFGRNVYSSRAIGLLAAALLAILPSHIYYSRLGLQEAICTLLFTAGIYLYLTSRAFNWRNILSGFLFGCVFFTNYRLIIIPVITLATEVYSMWAQSRAFDFRKYIYNSLIFSVVVFGIGSLDGGANTKITFGWMFHQANLAKGTFDWINFFSYPYYIFRFETIIFGLLLLANVYFLYTGEKNKALPFFLIMMLMGIFSMPQEKGVRYLCVAYPLMTVAVAAIIVYVGEKFPQKNIKIGLGSLVGIMWLWQAAEAVSIMNFRSDYASVINKFKEQQQPIKISATQPVVLSVLAGENGKVIGAGFEVGQFLALYQQGYRYFIADPQMYVSLTADGERFSPALKPFLEFIRRDITPDKVYPHFSDKLLARFVMEHNENLRRSIAFLHSNQNQQLNKLYIYDIQKIVLSAQKALQHNTK